MAEAPSGGVAHQPGGAQAPPTIRVFARRAGAPSYALVTVPATTFVADLARAIVGELHLGAPMDMVELRVEGANTKLDARRTLAAEGVVDCSSVIATVTPPPASPPCSAATVDDVNMLIAPLRTLLDRIASQLARSDEAAAQPACPPPGDGAAPPLWPPTPDTYARIFGRLPRDDDDGDSGGERGGGAALAHALDASDAAARLRERAAMVQEAYGDVFQHLSVRRGWRSLPFTPAAVAPAFAAAAQVVALVRHMVDTAWAPGFRIRQVDGQAQEVLWGLGAPPPPGPALRAWRGALFRALVAATLRDGTGALADGLTPGVVDDAVRGHPGAA